MNRCVFSGRLTADPQISYLQGDKPKCCAKYTLAVPRSYSKTGEADFIRCVSFGRSAEVVEKYYRKGTKIIAEGRMQTGSYINKEGQKVYTCDLYVTDQEFAESKAASAQETPATQPQAQVQAQTQQYAQPQGLDGFMSIPDGIGESLPFN